jgi:cholesterol transport system auxiliary component
MVCLLITLRKIRFYCSVIVCTFLLPACTLLKPLPVKPIHYYTLAASSVPAARQPSTPQKKRILLITEPRTNAIYNNTHMIYIPGLYQIQFFSQNRWADTPAHMLHPLLIKALQNTGRFEAILNTATTMRYDFILNTQLLSFQQDFLSHPSQFRIFLRAQLINAKTLRILATQDFTVATWAPQDNPQGGVQAANCATRVLLEKIIAFCLNNTKVRTRYHPSSG